MLFDRDKTLSDTVTDRACVAQPSADIRSLGVQPLHMSAENGSVDTVRALLAAGADPSVVAAAVFARRGRRCHVRPIAVSL